MFKIEKGSECDNKTFRLPVELIERLAVLAARNNLSMNKLVIQCLNYALDNLEEDDEPQK